MLVTYRCHGIYRCIARLYPDNFDKIDSALALFLASLLNVANHYNDSSWHKNWMSFRMNEQMNEDE